jgi:general secretion pathway protein A
MYLSYYGLDKNPFQISSDPSFLWLGEKHEEALATLRYGVMDDKGFLLITGDVGTGKTTLINALVAGFTPHELVHAIVTDPALDRIDFFNIIARSFRIPKKFPSKADFLIYFKKFLLFQHKKGRKVVLIIDESQRLSQNLLEEIRLLSNIERKGKKLLNIFFLGQNEFLPLLNANENRALKQRIALKYHLEPLDREETARYIRHRLRVAGGGRELFTPAAIKKIYAFSKGYPRLINVICDLALLTGYVDEAAQIGPDIIEACRREFTFAPTAKAKKVPIPREEAPAPDRARHPRAYFVVVVVLLTALLAASAALIYSVRNDPVESIREEIRQLRTTIQQNENRK